MTRPDRLWSLILIFVFPFAQPLAAGASAILLIYQPIITSSDATVIETEKGFAVLPIPFECHHYHGRPPYHAIAQPNPILTDAPRSRLPQDSNLLSRSGVNIGSGIDDDIVWVHFTKLRPPEGFDINPDDIAEATLECLRRMAKNAKNRPGVRIKGKPDESDKWQRWQTHFAGCDLSKPFTRPD